MNFLAAFVVIAWMTTFIAGTFMWNDISKSKIGQIPFLIWYLFITIALCIVIWFVL